MGYLQWKPTLQTAEQIPIVFVLVGSSSSHKIGFQHGRIKLCSYCLAFRISKAPAWKWTAIFSKYYPGFCCGLQYLSSFLMDSMHSTVWTWISFVSSNQTTWDKCTSSNFLWWMYPKLLRLLHHSSREDPWVSDRSCQFYSALNAQSKDRRMRARKSIWAPNQSR